MSNSEPSDDADPSARWLPVHAGGRRSAPWAGRPRLVAARGVKHGGRAAASWRMTTGMSMVARIAQNMMDRYGFMGVTVATFEQAGREQLITLLSEGLVPESTVLEFGCGPLRIAYWLTRFLDPGCYYGIEPARNRVEAGLEQLFTPEERAMKQPRFDFNADFDSSVFGISFDYFLARSIWSHASKRQIEAMLDSFVRDSKPSAIFLTSYYPAEPVDSSYRETLTNYFAMQRHQGDFQGDYWVGTSHESDTIGVVQHSTSWILDRCSSRGLTVTEMPGIDCDGQVWLKIARAP